VEIAMKIFVNNFPLDTTEKELQKAFESFGQVESTKIIKDQFTGRSKFAFVEMTVKDEACSAIKKLNGKNLNGGALLVNEALRW
jgi:RNA recognition motif-containing protein